MLPRLGSPSRLRELNAAFNQPPDYGRDLDWSGYTVYDAAGILLKLLLRLPESVIPSNLYLKFQQPLLSHILAARDGRTVFDVMTSDENKTAIKDYRELVATLPPLPRHLLLYLLSLMVIIASMSKIGVYKMTASGAVAEVFQPAILAPARPSEDSRKKSAESRYISRKILIFMMENRNLMLT